MDRDHRQAQPLVWDRLRDVITDGLPRREAEGACQGSGSRTLHLHCNPSVLFQSGYPPLVISVPIAEHVVAIVKGILEIMPHRLNHDVEVPLEFCDGSGHLGLRSHCGRQRGEVRLGGGSGVVCHKQQGKGYTVACATKKSTPQPRERRSLNRTVHETAGVVA
jgi:hypothetical protein